MPILFDSEKKIFKLDTKTSSYIFMCAEHDRLLHAYYGARISDVDVAYLTKTVKHASQEPHPAGESGSAFSLSTAMMEVGLNGCGDFRIAALQIRYPDGTSSVDLRYRSHKIYAGKPAITGLPATYASEDEATTLELETIDPATGLTVVLYYTVFENYGAMTRHMQVKNTLAAPVVIERAMSLSVDFPTMDYDLVHLYGGWARECSFTRDPLHHGVQHIYSRRGSSSAHHNPFLAMVGRTATEETGEAYGFSFVYSGNFYAGADCSTYGSTRVLMGLDADDFAWTLAEGESFYTPEVVMTYSDKGIGEMSRTFHRLYRHNLCRGEWKTKKRPVLINNWEATTFRFDAEKIYSIAEAAAPLGVEMLVLDDGWFLGRNTDKTSLGDWYVDEEKLPGGLGALVERINGLGMQFGLWFEPEMISYDSNLYRAHPDWAIGIPGREMSEGRYQYMLDMSRTDVQDYLYERLCAILDSANIVYVKWDYNRVTTEAASALLPANRQKEFFHRYILGFYALLERLLTRYPKLLLEGCSSGGNRFDAGMLYYAPQSWGSDNTDAIERVYIQYGMSMVYPTSSVGAHVSACPNRQLARTTPLETRANVAMAGSFGYELDATKWTAEEREQVKAQVARFHKYYDVIHNGDLYRLISPYGEFDRAAWSYVAADKSEVLVTYVVIRSKVHMRHFIKLAGLDPNRTYRNTETGECFRGDTLMHAGLNLTNRMGDFDSMQIHFVAE